jgi:uncharacterized membrane protein
MPSKNKSPKTRDHPPAVKRSLLLPLSVIFLFLLRFVHLDQSFWLDETVQALVSQNGLSYYLTHHLQADFNPPLFYLLTIAWTKLFPLNEVLFRLPSLIFFALSSLLVYKTSQLLSSSSKIHLSALFLTLSSPLLLYYSQEARPYMMATFTTLASTFFFLKFIKTKDFKNLFLHSLFLTLSIFTHYTTLLLFPAYFLYLFLTRQKILKKYFLSWILPLTCFLLYSPVFLSQLKHSQVAHQLFPGWFLVIGKSNLKSVFLFFTKFIIGRISFTNKVFYLFLALFLIPLYWLPALKRGVKKPLFLFLLLPPLLAFIISFKSPIFDYFRFLYCLPYLYLLIARNSHSGLIKLLIGLNLLFSLLYLFNPAFHREDWKTYCQYLKTLPQDTPVLLLQATATPLTYYCPDQNIILIDPDLLPNTFSSDGVKQNAERFDSSEVKTIVLTDYALPIFDPENKIEQTLSQTHTLKEVKNFHLIQTKIFTKT